MSKIEVVLEASKLLAFCYVALMAFVWFSMFLLPWPWYITFFLAMTGSIYILRDLLKKALLCTKNSICKLKCDHEGWCLLTRNGIAIKAHLQGDSFISPALLILIFKPINQWLTQSVIITKNKSNQEMLRQLQVYLQLEKGV